MARLDAAQRKAAPHAGPHGSFPIPDVEHARLALQMRSHAKDPAEIVRRVKAKFPGVGKSLLATGLKSK